MKNSATYVHIGALILWAARVDEQLTKAVILTYHLRNSPMLEHVIAELDARAKIELLIGAAKQLRNAHWRKQSLNWLEDVETLNRHRNTVAHHVVAVHEGKLVLHSRQARKLLKRLRKGECVPPPGRDDVHQWANFAVEVYGQGEVELANLEKIVTAASRVPEAPQEEIP